ncbi:MAG TPA: hypothetical protein VIL35_05670 [Vicinamibacterales bacterium]
MSAPRGLPARAAAVALMAYGALAAAGCAARGFAPPDRPGTPVPVAEASEALTSVWRGCDGLTTYTAEAALSGRAGSGRVRGRLHLGLSAEGGIRIEAVAPFGLLFVLAGGTDGATLFLPREGEVLRDTPAPAILETVSGLNVSPQALLAMLSGCIGHGGDAAGAFRHGGDLLEVRVGQAVVWLRGSGAGARLVAARDAGVLIDYGSAAGEHPPREVRLRAPATGGGGNDVDLRLALSQIELNVPLEPAAFTVSVPASAREITLDELRRSGLLR